MENSISETIELKKINDRWATALLDCRQYLGFSSAQAALVVGIKLEEWESVERGEGYPKGEIQDRINCLLKLQSDLMFIKARKTAAHGFRF